MNVYSKFDAYLTNMNEFKYEREWNMTYPSYAICMYGSIKLNHIIRVIFCSRIIFLGLDEGKINFLKIPTENGFARYYETDDGKAH